MSLIHPLLTTSGCIYNDLNTDLIIAVLWERRTATGKIKSGLLSKRNVSSISNQCNYQEPKPKHSSVFSPAMTPVAPGICAPSATSLASQQKDIVKE